MADTFVVPWQISGTAPAIITAAGTQICFRVPQSGHGGGVRVLEAGGYAGQGTATVTIIDMGSSATGNEANIIAHAFANAANQSSISVSGVDHWLDAGDYVGVLTAAGTVKASVGGWLTCVQGK